MLQPTTHNLADGLLQALGSLFTVGAVHPGGAANVTLDVAAGAIWVVIVALQIAYLPALYAAFSQREGLVAMLESRAGVPAWGPELLARHQLVGIIDTLPELYSAWEEWAAAVAESHTTYPVLLLFRSPNPGSRGCLPSWPCSTGLPCTWPCHLPRRRPTPGCVCAWALPPWTASAPCWAGAWIQIRCPMRPYGSPMASSSKPSGCSRKWVSLSNAAPKRPGRISTAGG